MKKKLYVDMDGVLCDFDGRFVEIFNYSPLSFISKFGSDKFISAIDHYGHKFWSEMGWTGIGPYLWSQIKDYNPIILSNPSKFNSSRHGKSQWIKTNIGDYDYILRPDKESMANESSMLLDDLIDNIDKFNQNGGIGVRIYDDETVSETAISIVKGFFDDISHIVY